MLEFVKKEHEIMSDKGFPMHNLHTKKGFSSINLLTDKFKEMLILRPLEYMWKGISLRRRFFHVWMFKMVTNLCK